MSNLVYLCGPMAGLTWTEANEWRAKVKKHLGSLGIECLCPLRNKTTVYETGDEIIKSSYNHPLCTPKGIVTLDFNDIRRCDLLFANFLGVNAISIGSILEIGAAHILNKPVILCCEGDNIHYHVMISEIADFIVGNLREGIKIAESILNKT